MVQVKKKKPKIKKEDAKNKDESVELMQAGTSSTNDDQSNLYTDEYSYKPSLTKVIFRTFGAYYFSANLIKFFHDCMLLISPCLLYTSPSPRDRG